MLEPKVNFEGGRNQWMTNDEIRKQEHTFVNVDDRRQMDDAGSIAFEESRFDYSPADY